MVCLTRGSNDGLSGCGGNRRYEPGGVELSRGRPFREILWAIAALEDGGIDRLVDRVKHRHV